ncbi:MAG: nitroreductase family protein [Capnocytophaga sp.]|nr:nitroreductase family protein [Capnocytophaga sp.]
MKTHEILYQIIEERKSHYPSEYIQSTPIDTEIIGKILHSATFAPNHRKTEPWRLKAFRESEKNDLGIKMASLYKETTPEEKFSQRKYDEIIQKAEKSDTIISICIRFSGKVPQWEEIAAVAMGVQNMYLMCTAYGLGCYWSTPGFVGKLKEYLLLDEQTECYGLFYIGKI